MQTKIVMAKPTKSYLMDLQIDRYLKGKMMADEESMFISQLHSDNKLRERAYVTAMVITSGNNLKETKLSFPQKKE